MKKILLSFLLSGVVLFATFNDANTDYSNEPTKSFSEEPSLRSLKTVNMVLDILSQTRSSEFVNKGPYMAMIKEKDEKGEVHANNGASSSSNNEQLSKMTLLVTRKSATSPMIVKFWLEEEAEDTKDEDQIILGHMIVSQAVSSEYPLGKLEMHFSGFGINSDRTTNFSSKSMGGILITDKGTNEGQAQVIFKNTSTEEGRSFPQDVKLVFDTQGIGTAIANSIEYSEHAPALKTYKLALGNQYYLIQEVNSSDHSNNIGSLIVKDKNSVSHKVFRYGVYNENNGSKLKLNSGYPIVKIDTNGKEYHGYIGYWGLWAENNSIKNNDIVFKENDRDKTTAYKIVQTPGKLKKFTKHTVEMSKLHNSKMYFYNNGQQYIIAWDKNAGGGNGNYKILGTQNDHTGEANILNGVTGQYIFNTNGDDNSSNPLTINNWSSAWSDSLRAQIPIKIDMNNTVEVSFSKEETVVPSSDLTLVNFGYELLNPNATNINDLMISENGINNVIGNVYSFNSESLTLVDQNRSNVPVIIPSDINLSGSNNSWGANVGPLLALDRALDYNASNFWDVRQNERVYYEWETGPNNWNKFTGIKLNNGGNDLISFDAPINFTYEHNTSSDINNATDVNGTYSLQYDGFSLQVPWKNINGDWVPKFNIKNATKISDSNGNYVIKILDEALLVNTAQGSPSHGLTMPGVNDPFWVASSVSHDDKKVRAVGEKPLNAKVKVIKGKLVD